MEKILTLTVVAVIGVFIFLLFCETKGMSTVPEQPPSSTSGVAKATANISIQSNGLTVEQENIKKRLEIENKPGTIQHLYVLSAYSGQVLIDSTVKGKITSSGKRLTPYSVACSDGEGVYDQHMGFPIGFIWFISPLEGCCY